MRIRFETKVTPANAEYAVFTKRLTFSGYAVRKVDVENRYDAVIRSVKRRLTEMGYTSNFHAFRRPITSTIIDYFNGIVLGEMEIVVLDDYTFGAHA